MVVGGGLPVGGCVVLEEDANTRFHKTLAQYFAAEGLACGHRVVVVADSAARAQGFVDTLPLNTTLSEELGAEPAAGDGDGDAPEGELTIAWRYRRYFEQSPGALAPGRRRSHIEGALVGTVPSHSHDFTRTIQRELVGKERLATVVAGSGDLVQQIADAFPRSETTVTRIVVHSLGTPLWELDQGGLGFLRRLRRMLRQSLSVAWVGIPTYLYADQPRTVAAVRHAGDTVLALRSFSGEGARVAPAFSEFAGLLTVVRLPRINSMAHFLPDTWEYGVKIRRRRVLLEKLHPPPEGDANHPPSRSGNKGGLEF